MEKFYNFAHIEKETQAFWRKNKIYRFDPDSKAPVYSIDTPPPTVSGSLHIGHLFSFTQAEIIARFHWMQGENVFYPFGFDDNGLPTERLVEREQGVRAADMPRSDFIALCRETSARYEKEFRDFWESLGFSADWDLQYRTVSPAVQKLAQEKKRGEDFALYSMIARLGPQVIAERRRIYKGVSPNVDFYSGFVYSMLDIPPELYTPIFAMARIVGWSAHMLEELTNVDKIIRPAYKSVSGVKPYVPLTER